jgi:hypothetical protein
MFFFLLSFFIIIHRYKAATILRKLSCKQAKLGFINFDNAFMSEPSKVANASLSQITFNVSNKTIRDELDSRLNDNTPVLRAQTIIYYTENNQTPYI